MTRKQANKVLGDQGHRCSWCGMTLNYGTAVILTRRAGPLAMCRTCANRHENPDEHPYMQKALGAKGL
jgi:hypothetical protein